MQPRAFPEVSFPSGELRPALGIGTWHFGESRSTRAAETAAVRLALEIGYRVIDTAEMYGSGGAEEVVGAALADAVRAGGVAREDLFVVSKALPNHAGESALQSACEASLRRLKIEQLDLYLLHWRGGVPLAETVRGMEQLQRRGLVRLWGVSNLDLADMHELAAVPGGRACAANQVYFSLGERGVQFELLPWMRVQQMPLMAYSPFDQGALVQHAALRPLAERLGATPAQVALAWLLAQPGVLAIPKAGAEQHLRENWAAQQLVLGAEDLAALDRAFPPPKRRTPLAMI